jgi:hypothetical protein
MIFFMRYGNSFIMINSLYTVTNTLKLFETPIKENFVSSPHILSTHINHLNAAFK